MTKVLISLSIMTMLSGCSPFVVLMTPAVPPAFELPKKASNSR